MIIFLLLTIAVALLAAAYWALAKGQTSFGVRLEEVRLVPTNAPNKDERICADLLVRIAGGFTFALNLVAWYILAGQMLQCVDSPMVLPVGDLSMRVPSATLRAKAREEV